MTKQGTGLFWSLMLVHWSLIGHWDLGIATSSSIPATLVPVEQLLHLRRDRLEEVVLALAEEREVRVGVPDEGSKDPAHPRADQGKHEHPDPEHRLHRLVPGESVN